MKTRATSPFEQFSSTTSSPQATTLKLKPDMDICQTDYPLDWYQKEFAPYAKEYLALPDRRPTTIIPWMKKYIDPVMEKMGDQILLLAHFYMGGEIVKLVELFGGQVADSYQLALMAKNNPQKKIIIESAVHFMAESIAILAADDQRVYITNPKSGCTMEMQAKDYMVAPAFAELNQRYGKENILPVCYMNTSGRIKALTGDQGGAVCTSSNVKKIFEWALRKNKKIFFIPDQHMGENVASWVGIKSHEIAHWPGGTAGAQFQLAQAPQQTQRIFDAARLVVFDSSCGVHTFFQKEMADYWKNQNHCVVVHPECPKAVVDAANHCGSTAFLWDYVLHDRAGTGRYAVGTEKHFVDNLKLACENKNITVVNLGEAPLGHGAVAGCGCATMARNDPPHLVGLLDLIGQGKAPDINEVKAGDVVGEFNGTRQRLDPQGQAWTRLNARKALEKMIEITTADP